MPLSHLTVLDLTRVRSGPTAVRQLADWGADVVKIEAPDEIDTGKGMGGARHGPDFQNTHRNKRGITLNLKHPEGLAVFRTMAARADVVVENYRPDVKDRLGIGYDSLAALNPAIILASISGFGQDGPYARRPGFDQIAQGMGGLMSVTGLPGQGPVRAGIPVADLTTGLYTALGILIAVIERQKTGRGRWVHTSLLESMIAMMDFQAARWTMKQEVAGQTGNDHPTTVPTGLFHTKDGTINVAAGGQAMWDRLQATLGFADDPDLMTEKQRGGARARVNAVLQTCLLTDTAEAWVQRLNDAGVPCGMVNTMDQVFADPQVQHLGMRLQVESALLGTLDLVRPPMRLEGATPRTRSTPERGEHTEAVLAGFGIDAARVAALRAMGAV